MAFLEVRGLTVRYPGEQVPALRDVSFTIEAGENVLLLGPSGGGKSTLALALNGVIPHSVEADVQGDVRIAGKSVHAIGVREASREIGILFQDPDAQFCMLTVEDEVAFGLENLGLPRAEISRRLKRGLAAVGMLSHAKRSIAELSGGMKQKLGLACLLAMDQPMFILDEPTANLDPGGAEEVLDAIARLAHERKKAFLFIEHQLDRLVSLIDRVLVLGRDGTLLFNEPPRKLFAEHTGDLVREGIWVPRVSRSAWELAVAGWKWPVFPLTLQEWDAGIPPADDAGPLAAVGSTESTSADAHAACANGRHSADGVEKPLLEVEEVQFSYGKRSVLRGVTFRLQAGEFVALLGSNGAGKSTLAQILLRLLVPTSGCIRFGGKPLEDWNLRQLYRRAGFVFQNPEHQFVADTVEKELAYGFAKSGMERERWWPRVQEQMERFGLTPYRTRHPFQLSQGQKRRLSVATMLVHDQELLVLDEPTFGQDMENTEQMMNMFTQFCNEGKAILMITHDLELAHKYAERVLVLDQGAIAFDGPPAALFADRERLRRFALSRPLSLLLEERLASLKGGRRRDAGIVTTT